MILDISSSLSLLQHLGECNRWIQNTIHLVVLVNQVLLEVFREEDTGVDVSVKRHVKRVSQNHDSDVRWFHSLLQLMQHDAGQLFTATNLSMTAPCSVSASLAKAMISSTISMALSRVGSMQCFSLGLCLHLPRKLQNMMSVPKIWAMFTSENNRATASLDTLIDWRHQEFCRSSGISCNSRTISGTNRRAPLS